MDNARTIHFQEVGIHHIFIHIKPQIFGEQCEVLRFAEVGRHKVVVHIGAHVLHFVAEIQVVDIEIGLFEPLVEFIGCRTGHHFFRLIREDGGSELIVATR